MTAGDDDLKVALGALMMFTQTALLDYAIDPVVQCRARKYLPTYDERSRKFCKGYLVLIGRGP